MIKPPAPRALVLLHILRQAAFRGPRCRHFSPARMTHRGLPTTPGSSRAYSSTIHVLGIGNIGLLFAHSIAQSHGAQTVTLLFHRETLAKEWYAAGEKTELVCNGIPDRQKGYNIEILPALHHAGDTEASSPIHNLIIATKATKTLAAFATIRPRLTPQSIVVFCQNGMGILDEIEAKFPELASNSRPHFLAGIVTHGVYSTQPFHIVHAGRGTVTIGPLCVTSGTEHPLLQPLPQLGGYLPELLARTPALSAVCVPALQVLQAQLEKLVINAIINPLTVLFNCLNGQLFRESDTCAPNLDSMVIHDPATKLMHLLLSEICQVIQSLPELQSLSGKEVIFSVGRMRSVVIDVATKTGANTSSMLQDFRANRKTEIQYINGYIVTKGNQAGVACGMNDRVVKIVEGGRHVSIEEILEIFPELSTSACAEK